MSMVAKILDRLSGIEVVKEKLRDTGARVERLAQHVVDLDRQLHDMDRRLVRIETIAELATAQREAQRRLPKADA